VHFVIIGGSAAGISAAETLRHTEPGSDITIISQEPHIAYSRCLCTYYMSGRISRDDMFIRDAKQLDALKLKVMAPVAVMQVNTADHMVSLTNGDSVHYDRLLVASGSSPVLPDIKGIEGESVYTLRTLDDADRIAAKMDKVASAVVLGDGLVSITAAIALNSRGLRVSIAGIAPHILATFLDEVSAQILQHKMSDLGINFHLGQSITEITRDINGKGTRVTLTSGVTIDAGMVVVAAGVKPNIAFMKDAGVKTDIGLLVNKYMETGVPDIFAAGDAAQCQDIVRNQPAWNPLWPNAVEQGRYAALNMSGHRKPYPGTTNMNSLNIAGIPVICVGIANTVDPLHETHFLMKGKTQYEKLVFHDNRLIGFILLGNTEKAGVLTSLVVQQRVSPTQKEKLLSGSYSYTGIAGIGT